MDFRTPSSKALWTALLLVLALGYAFAAGQIYTAVGVTPGTILDHYQGNEEALLPALSVERLMMLSHAHMLGMPLIVFPAAWLFTRTRLRESFKAAVIVATFSGIVLDIGSWWGVRFLGMPMLVPLFLGGVLLEVGFLVMTTFGLIHLWRDRE